MAIGVWKLYDPRMATLSRRQAECIQGVADHLDSQQIAQRIGISPHTVDGHVAAAMRALGARTRREAVSLWKAESGETLTGKFSPVSSALKIAPNETQPMRVEEGSTPLTGWLGLEGERDERSLRISPLAAVGLVFAVAAALAVIILAIAPLIEGARALAKLIN